MYTRRRSGEGGMTFGGESNADRRGKVGENGATYGECGAVIGETGG